MDLKTDRLKRIKDRIWRKIGKRKGYDLEKDWLKIRIESGERSVKRSLESRRRIWRKIG